MGITYHGGSATIIPGTSTQWANSTTKIPRNVLCFDTDTKQLKIGDGKSTYGELPFQIDAVLTAEEKSYLVHLNEAGGIVILDEDGYIPASAQHPVVLESPDGSLAITPDGVNPLKHSIVLSDTGVAAGQYGDAYYTAVPTIDEQGRVTDIDLVKMTPVWTDVESIPANIGALAGLTGAADLIPYFTAAGTMSTTTATSYSRGLLSGADVGAWRAGLQLVPGTHVQAYDATLQALAGTVVGANKLIYATGVDTFATTDYTAYGRILSGLADAAALRTNLSLVPGTDILAYDTGLQSIAGLTTVADRMLYTTASDTYATTPLTSFMRTLLDDGDASTARQTLGLVIGTNVQAYDGGLASIAALTGSGVVVASTTDTYGLRAIGVGAADSILDRQSADGRYLLRVNSGTVSISGTINFTTAAQVNGVALATMNDLTAAIDGTTNKGTVDYATTTNITLSGIQNIDGGTGVVGQKILVKDQTNKAENGIRTMAVGAWPRVSNMDSWSEVPGAVVAVLGGTQANRVYRAYASSGGTIDVTDIVWAPDSGPGTYTASNGVTINGSNFELSGQALALHQLAGTGIPVRTGTDTFAIRTLVQPSAGFSITNPTGAAGNFTFALTNDLAALEGLIGTGIPVRTTTDTYVQRSVVTANSNRVTVTNGDGVAGNITLSGPQDIHSGATPTFAGQNLTGLLSFNAGLSINNGIRWQGSAKEMRLVMKASNRVVMTDETDGQELFSFYEDGRFAAHIGAMTATQLQSTVATGTAPLSVVSTTRVDNLNAQYISGLQSSQFLRSDQSSTISGLFTVSQTGANNSAVYIDSAAGQSSSIRLRTGTSTRWFIGKDQTAESGSNAGANLAIMNYDDAGNLVSIPATISRATGVMTLSQTPLVGSNAVWHAGNFTPGNYAPLSGATFTGTVSIQSAAPILQFVESDQTDPAGRWRFAADGGSFRLDRSTSAGFATRSSPVTFAADDSATFVGSVQAAQHLTSGGTIGDNVGDSILYSRARSSAGNTTDFLTQLVRHTAGSNWTGTSVVLSRRVDTTDQGFMKFGYSGANYGLAFGTGSTDYLRMDDAGNWSIPTTSLNFGTTLRQMINLYSTSFGIGVQNSTAYIRTGSRFSVYAGGAHTSTENGSGGGSVIFTATTAGAEFTGTVQGTRLISTVTAGTAPLTVASSTKVTNLNADLLDGMDADTSPTAGTIVARDATGAVRAAALVTSGTSPRNFIQETDGGVDGKYWDELLNGGVLYQRVLNDAQDTAYTWMYVTRSGTDVTGITYRAQNLAFESSVASGGLFVTNYAATEGPEIRLRTADGTSSAPSQVSNGKILSDISTFAYVGSAFQDVFYQRVVAGTVSGGYCPASYSLIFRNGGSFVTSMTASYSGVSFAVPVTSTVATGTAPFVVTSTTKVANLNADLLDDMTSATAATATTIAARDGSGDLTARAMISYAGNTFNIDTYAQTGYWAGVYQTPGAGSSGTNPDAFGYYTVVQLFSNGGGQGLQLACSYSTNDLYKIRRRSDNAAAPNGANAWQPWVDLYTSSSHPIGTAAWNLVRLNGSAQLPAVDGSLLTNVKVPKWAVVSGAATLLVNTKYIYDASASSVTLTLPASPANGDSVTIRKVGTVGSISLLRNGQKITNVADDGLIEAAFEGTVELVFLNTSYGWSR